MTFSVSIQVTKKADVQAKIDSGKHGTHPLPEFVTAFLNAALMGMEDEDFVNISISGSVGHGSGYMSASVSKTAAPASPPNA